MRFPDRMRVLVLVAVALALLAVGCSEEDNPFIIDTGGDIPASKLPFPATPDQLMANFLAVYETADLEEYGLLLAPGFATRLQPATIQDYPQVGSTLDVAEETRSHTRMFSGEDLVDAGGAFLPGIESFDFTLFSKVVDWGVSLPTDPVPNTLSALYNVQLVVFRGEQNPVISVSGLIRFYVKPATGRVDGESKTYYRMVSQLDLTEGGKASEQTPWGSLKALYY